MWLLVVELLVSGLSTLSPAESTWLLWGCPSRADMVLQAHLQMLSFLCTHCVPVLMAAPVGSANTVR